jgi:hypothetical protein
VITSGALPAGFTISNGVIAGTPTTAGVSTFSVNVYDSNLHYASQTFTLTIASAPVAVAMPEILPQGATGAAYSETMAASGGVPPYAWSIASGALPPGLALSRAGVIAGTPTAGGTYIFAAQVQDNTYLTASQPFSLTVTAPGTLPRTGIISQIVAGAGWDTTIWLVNRTSAAVQASLVFHLDDGSSWNLALTVTPQPSSQGPGSVTATIAPNTTLVVATGVSAANSPNVQGWADVLSNGALSGFAVFRDGGAAEAAVPLQTQIGTSISLPFDNTNGYSTGIALVNLSGSPASITATVWDQNGNQVGKPLTVTLTKNDANGNGHDSFMLPDRLAVTAKIRGIVQFQGNPGTASVPAGQLTGLGLHTDPNGLFTSIPTIVP